MITKGFANVPLDAPGLGIELNEEEIRKHLNPKAKGYFEPTPEWDEKDHTTDYGVKLLIIILMKSCC